MIASSKPILVAALLALCSAAAARPSARPEAPRSWSFAVSGDSRNCGNLVMPAIAAGARADHAAFYWHLGDLRAIYKVDEDYTLEQRFRTFSPPPTLDDYLHTAWSDFTQHQVRPFGELPFFLGIGNHETVAPKTRSQFLIEFQPLLDRPQLAQQRAADAALYTNLSQPPVPRTYYHWREHGVDFINLDNATDDSFDQVQLAWLDALLAADSADASLSAVVVGMHEALPYSKSDSHSMCSSLSGRTSGLRVYEKLLELQQKKHVYLLASHSHYYLANLYDTEHWREHGGVLPGWVVGTAGAERYGLPPDVAPGPDAREHVYGYLLGTLQANGEIRFAFHDLGADQLNAVRESDYRPEDVAFCITANPGADKWQARPPKALTCEEALRH